MHTRKRLLLCAAGALALMATGLPAAATDAVACGGTITASATLTHDLDCPTGYGLTIRANGTAVAPIVLDLNGHTIRGAGPAGIRFTGQNYVVVRDGTISGFGAGVELQQSMRVTLTGLDVSAVYRGINVGGGGHHLIEKNTITAQSQDGIRIGASSDNVVSENTVTGAVWGISVAEFTTSNLVEKNLVTDSREHGIGAFGSARGVKLVENVTTHNRDGIAVGRDVEGALLESNEARDNRDDGIQVDSRSAVVETNSTTGNGGLGVEAVEGVTATGNRAADNRDPSQCTGVVCTRVS